MLFVFSSFIIFYPLSLTLIFFSLSFLLFVSFLYIREHLDKISLLVCYFAFVIIFYIFVVCFLHLLTLSSISVYILAFMRPRSLTGDWLVSYFMSFTHTIASLGYFFFLSLSFTSHLSFLCFFVYAFLLHLFVVVIVVVVSPGTLLYLHFFFFLLLQFSVMACGQRTDINTKVIEMLVLVCLFFQL